MGDNDPLTLAAAWRDGGHGVALATVVATWGSSPRPAGSQLVVRDDGVHQGSVSGGCIEGAVIEEALAVINGGDAKLLSYGVTNERAWEVGLSCGGTVEVHVAPIPEILDQLLADRAAHRPVALLTNLETGDVELTHDHQALREDRSRKVDDVFVQALNPPLRLIIVGAVHIAQSLVQMAQLAGYHVTLVDPRGAFADRDSHHGWIHTELSARAGARQRRRHAKRVRGPFLFAARDMCFRAGSKTWDLRAAVDRQLQRRISRRPCHVSVSRADVHLRGDCASPACDIVAVTRSGRPVKSQLPPAAQ